MEALDDSSSFGWSPSSSSSSSSATSDVSAASDSSASTGSSQLAPWMDVLNGSRVEFAPLPDDDEATDCRVVATVHVELSSLLASASDASAVMGSVRQTMELLRMAFLADVDTLAQLERDGWIDITGDTPPHHELHFPSRDLRFVLHYTALPRYCAATHQAIAAHLLTARPLCAGEVFQAAHDALNEECKSRFQIKRRGVPLEVELNVTVEGASDTGVTPEETEDVFWSIGIFASRVRAFKPSSKLWSTAYSDIRVSGVRLHIQDITLTRRVIFAVQETMQAHADVIQCLHCAVDTRRAACSEDELRDYLTALTASSPNAVVHVGYVPHNAPFLGLDSRGEDLTTQILKVLRAVGSCGSVRAINIAPLARLLSNTRNRACFWTSVLDFILCSTNPSPLMSLELTGHGGLLEQDVHHLQRIRTTVPKVRREVHSFTIDLAGIINADILDLIRWVGHVTTLSVRQRAGIIDSRMLAGIWSACPRVENVVLDKTLIVDMAVFSKAFVTSSSLKSLVIKNIEIVNTSTADEFFREVGNPSSAMGRQLQRLEIVRGSFDPRQDRHHLHAFALSGHQARLLADSLEHNTSLRRLKIAIQRDVAPVGRLRLLLHGHVNMAVNNTRKRHEQRVLAFLSVIATVDTSGPWGSLDSWTLRRIFAFSGPFDRRSVVLVDE